MAQLFAGTSGFAYAAWRPEFYPQKVASKDFLKYYATRLNAVEINYTFRQLPKAAMLENGAEGGPATTNGDGAVGGTSKDSARA